MATIAATRERGATTVAAAHDAAREKRNAARRARDEAQVRAGRAVHLVQYGGPDALELLRAREAAVSLERVALEAEQALETAEAEYQAAAAVYGRERVKHFKPLVRAKLAKLDEALEQAARLCGELQRLGIEARRDSASEAFDSELCVWAGMLGDVDRPQSGSPLSAWRERLQRAGWL